MMPESLDFLGGNSRMTNDMDTSSYTLYSYTITYLKYTEDDRGFFSGS